MKKLILIQVLFFAIVITNAQVSLQSIKIGSQTWSTENLNVVTFRNGDTIPQVKTDTGWAKAAKYHRPAWCYYRNNPANSKAYGKLYNWYAVTDKRGLAPKGWHIPTNKEWQKLTDKLGGYKIACTKLKSKVAWETDGNGDNSTGFLAIPSGQRITEIGFIGLGTIACYWSSTSDDNYSAFYMPLTKHGDATNMNYFKSAGFSVRCIKD